MANYSLVSTSKFEPFSFERYMQPLLTYGKMYDERYKELQQQSLLAGLMESMVDPEIDKEVYKGLQNYNGNLNRLSEVMANVGLLPGSKKEFLELWKQYAKDVAPIQNWINMRNEAIKAQDALRLQTNGNIAFTKDARKTPLDYYRKGRPLDYETMNMNAAMAEATALIQAISKRNIESGQNSLGDYMETYKKQGYVDLNELMSKSAEAKAAIEMILNKYGYNNPNFSDADKSRLLSAVQEGATGGLYYDENKSYSPNWRAQEQLKDRLSWNRFVNETNYNKANNPDWQLKQIQLDQLRKANGAGSSTFDIRTPIDGDEIGMGVSSKYSKNVSGAKDAMKTLGIREKTTDKGQVMFAQIQVPTPDIYSDRYWLNKSSQSSSDFNKGYGKAYNYQGQVAKITKGVTPGKGVLKTDGGSNYMRVFDKNGKLLTRQQFAQQNKQYSAYLEAYYDKFIVPAISTLNNTRSNNVTVQGLYKSGSKSIDLGRQTVVYGIPINFEDNIKMLKGGAVGRLINNSGGAREIKGSIEDWRNGRKRSANDVYNLLDAVDGQYYVSYHIINTVGNDGKKISGILLTSGKRRFFIPAENMSQSGKLGFEKLDRTQKAKEQRDKDIAAYQKQFGNEWAYYYANDVNMQRSEASIKNSGTEALQDIVRSFTGNTYNIPTFDVINQSLTDN